MRLPSLRHLAHQTSQTFLRFPFVLLSAGLGTWVALVKIELELFDEKNGLDNLLLTAALGLPLFTAITLTAEKRGLSRAGNLLCQGTGALLLAAYYFSLPANVFSPPSVHLIRFFLLNLALHALVAFAPYLGKNDLNGFWQYNKTLFLRFLTAALYSGVLFLGLSIALLAIDNLFEVNIDGKRYGELWVLIAGMFNTWFFLAGIPDDLETLEHDTRYPKGLKIFTQYILLPLVVIYLIILYAYEARIILAWNWPKGWVANLVLGFSVTGILALLLVHPIQNQAENKWLRSFGKWYYVALIPLVAMLLLAIGRRISDYGVTENRYFVLVMGLALAGIVLYFIFSRVKNIKVIPTTLCVLAFLSSFGPWGAFAVSERSQVNRLERLLVKNSILMEAKVRKAPQPVPFEDAKEISSIVNYLNETHGVGVLQPWFEQNLAELESEKPDSSSREYSDRMSEHYRLPARIVALMGLDYVNEWQTEPSHSFNFTPESPHATAIDIEEYDYLIRLQSLSLSGSPHTFALGLRQYNMIFDKARDVLAIFPTLPQADSLKIDLRKFVDGLIQEFGTSSAASSIPAEKMIMEQSGPGLRAKIFFTNLSGEKREGVMQVSYVQADFVLIKILP